MPLGHFEYLGMPSGLIKAPTVFQTLVNNVLRYILKYFVFANLDILIYSQDLDLHRNHVQGVLQRLLENWILIIGEKCEFRVSTISFVEFILESWQTQSDPEKIKVIADWPVPENHKPAFSCIHNFFHRRLIHNYCWDVSSGPLKPINIYVS